MVIPMIYDLLCYKTVSYTAIGYVGYNIPVGMHQGPVAMQPMTAMPPGGMFPGMAQPHPFWGHPTAPLHPSPGMLPQRFAPHPIAYSIEVRLSRGSFSPDV